MPSSPPDAPSRRALKSFLAFVQGEAAAGVLLMGISAMAVVAANSPAKDSYFAFAGAKLGGLTLQLWVNDLLMAVFFLLVGLEIKREMVEGQLSTWDRRILPGFAAVGGMAVPALIFSALNHDHGDALRGWAIPAATDIAFALGVLALLGPRVPISLKVFLTALAILDDLGAVLIIALFYTSNLDPMMLAGAGLGLSLLMGLNRAGVVRLWPYLMLGAVIWFLVFKSGVHATVAGVAVALTIPIGRDGRPSPLHRLEQRLHLPVAYGVLPVFGFVNAGVDFSGLAPGAMTDPVTLGIALGLFIGKQIGVFGFAAFAIKSGLVSMPAQANWRQLYGVALLCGIGFTMSLFIGSLAYSGNDLLMGETKLGVFLGSVASAVAGYFILRMATKRASLPG